MTRAYLPMTAADRAAMLERIGVRSADDLFREIPASARDASFDPSAGPSASSGEASGRSLPPALSEPELVAELSAMAAENTPSGALACFRGGGAYRRFVPAVVDEVIRRGEFLTCYTPYQAEVSQGTLQAIFEFQSLVCTLTGMDVANAGLYDGASALAEACLMACRVTGRSRIALASGVNPRYARVVRTYCRHRGIAVDEVSASADGLTADHACFALQSPDYYGRIALSGDSPSRRCQAAGALLVVSADPMSLALFRPPAEFGADIVTGEGQSLGLPLSFGGPYLGLLAARQQLLRQMPGRIVGQTTDVDGRRGYVLTLQTREQHIRRERASSNICTSQQLVALAVTVYLSCLGKAGLRQVARLCYEKAHYAAQAIAALPGYGLVYPEDPFFQEFVVRCPRPVSGLNAALRQRAIIGGIDVSADDEPRMLLCATEMNSRREIDALAAALAEAGGRR